MIYGTLYRDGTSPTRRTLEVLTSRTREELRCSPPSPLSVINSQLSNVDIIYWRQIHGTWEFVFRRRYDISAVNSYTYLANVN